ncbi:hypothetical protein QWY75_02465 [Pontixanthobacter aestiaquae]|uniref:Uncharacterized protein n=1 Tax=Pontixanthobacter aestiaquae TaxID=1509367 RepID=A0A844ZA62_9SPHN|nr:hypothetical protein [Pontixanthobacter aestiaquae]MDN3645067.1 hypothetical protein [Pontixanthobacter aestiaquae]MXO83933.1 hypothetical protein [Pontixanthobacter aestiaquae]
MAIAAKADQGSFEAFDEVCLGTGDLEASLPRAKEKGWAEFSPAADSMLGKHKEMLLDGPAIDRPEVVLLRKNSNRAEIIMWETRTLSQSDYIFNCEVVEEKAPNLDLDALKEWANVPIEERQVDDSPIYYDLVGGRFADSGGGRATAYHTTGDGPRETLSGLNVHNFRSSFPEEGTD